ncbi:porin [Bradyrhizobium sp. ISRA443]|uniref:porin n=1 Tax=unclassified Bradyrhizobium TaxID=2631580 RepID=UPI0024788B35|nr:MULTISPECIES: porin [unclassified Bradyrhizobium]WGS02276.1 porin [Bradyrhizobium sp. ISRA436]WGS09161.1 porin [Bradyrhizobium sp. ISRA437]WGS16050.1 porin [Bradyrhizobium sp. ISRA443]
MKLVKSLILGSAAALVAVGGAQAADLPVKAKAVEYVKVCSLYGPGFYYIPGTDTCIKLGGYLRADVLANTNTVAGPNYNGANGANNRFTNGYTWRSREDLNIDTRTATEYGVVRTYFDAVFTWTSGTYAGVGNGSTTYSGDAVAGGSLGVYYAFIQFAGFTIGKAVSQFAAPWTGYPGNNFDGLVGGVNTTTGVNQFTYTAQFGNGVSLSLSAQDQTLYSQAGVNNLSAGGAYGASDYAGTIAPDLIASLKVDQAWGLFQASFAAHDSHAAYYGGTELTGHPDDKWGWAGALALSIKNIPTGPGDVINVQGVYTDGATRYNIQDLASQAGAIAMFGGSNLPGVYGSVGFGTAPDTVFIAGGQQQTIKTWGMRGAYTHNWNPYWNTAIYGAYAAVMYNDTAKSYICGVGGVGGTFRTAFGTGVTTCNPDYNLAQIGVITRWTPVKNLTFSADVTYSHLDQKYAGTIAFPGSAAIGKPAATYELKDQDTVMLLLRAQRNW